VSLVAVFNDVKYAWVSIRRSRSFAVAAVASIACLVPRPGRQRSSPQRCSGN